MLNLLFSLGPVLGSLILFSLFIGCWILFFSACKRWGMSYVITVGAITIGLFIYELISISHCRNTHTHSSSMFPCLGSGFFEMHLLILGALNIGIAV